MKKETIAAISTGMTNSGIGIVRISGEDAFEIADRVYKGKYKISECDSHTIHYGHIADGFEIIDEVLVMVMKAPRTFTGEKTVEINCHGGTMMAESRPGKGARFTLSFPDRRCGTLDVSDVKFDYSGGTW